MPLTKEQALESLVELEVVEKVKVDRLHPDDVIVVECGVERLSSQEMENIQAFLSTVWPGRKVVICPKGYRIRIIRATADDQVAVDATPSSADAK